MKAGSFRVEVALATHIMTCLLAAN
jgi:hypothetical protein